MSSPSVGSESRLILGVVGFSLLALFVGWFVFPRAPEPQPHLLPWNIVTLPDGTSRVFGLHLGEDTLAAAEQAFRETTELTLFVAPDGHMAAEAYFDELDLGGLRAKMVVEAALGQVELAAMYERGLRISTLGDGSRKVTLAPEDAIRVRHSTIASLTYLPKMDLDEALVVQRFGTPAQKTSEADGAVAHWLYPSQGLDVVVSQQGKEVLQYVPPRDFERVTAPLRQRGLL